MTCRARPVMLLVAILLTAPLAMPLSGPAQASSVTPTQVHLDTFTDGSEWVAGPVGLLEGLQAEIRVPAGSRILNATMDVQRMRFSAEEIPLGYTPSSFWVGDLDNNGEPNDIIVAYPEEGLVQVLKWETDPTRLSIERVLFVPDPTAVMVDDLDRDSDKDLLVTSGSMSRIYIFEALDKDTFAEPTYMITGPRPNSISVKDLNPDFRRDVVVGNSGGSSLTILMGRGDMTFYPKRLEVGRGPTAVQLWDMDKDLDVDIVVAETRNETVSVLYNVGNGNFTNFTTMATGPGLADIDVRDMNSDSLYDIAVACGGEDRVTVFNQLPDGSFLASELLEVGRAPGFVQALQANKAEDPNIDIAVACTGSDNLTIYMAGGDLRHTVPVDVAVGGRPIALTTHKAGMNEPETIMVLCQMPPGFTVLTPLPLADGIKLGFGQGGATDVLLVPIGSEGATLDIAGPLNRYIERHHGDARFGELVVQMEARADRSGWVNLSNVNVWAQPNRPPRAEAGENITVLVGETAVLNGSASYDPDGGDLDFKWLLPWDVAPSLTEQVSYHVFREPGTYMVLLVVVDRWGLQDQDVMQVVVNAPPVARGDVPDTVHALEPTRLTAHLSEDPDGTIVDYIWDYSLGVVHGRTVDVIFTGSGTWNVTLEVVDDGGARGLAQWQVEVLPARVPSRPPADHIPPDQGEVPGAGAVASALAILGAAGLARVSIARRRVDDGPDGPNQR